MNVRVQSCDCSAWRGLVFAAPKVAYDFTNLIKQNSETVLIERDICVEHLRELVLVVRLHSVDIDTDSHLSVRVVPAAPTRWAPDVAFLADDVLASVTFDGHSSAGELARAVCLPPLPSYVAIQLLAEQDLEANAVVAAISMELIGRE